MEVKEALGNLDQVCSEFKGTRTDHVVLQQSMQVVTAATVQDNTAKEAKPKKKESDGNKK
jgi:hypothetical protein